MRPILAAALILAVMPPAAAASELTSFRCGTGAGAPGSVRRIVSMENEYIAATGVGECWFHTGHHTWDMRGIYDIGTVTGSLFTVEANASAPTDIEPPNTTSVSNAAMFFTGSMDGTTWFTIRRITYNYWVGRQEVRFAFDAGGVRARYVRIHQPRSAFGGLAGFLDSSSFDATLTPVAPLPAAPATGARSCARDIMERFFDDHPCWFGGVNRYDSPSVFHTYPIGDTALARIRGTATFAPWRTDDYYYDGGSPTSLSAFVQSSVDGVTWTTLTTFSGRYGSAVRFDVSPAGMRASFVRIVAEYMKDPRRHPLKHVRGMLVDSSLDIVAA